jgi:curved DNA-binding protein CbpA
LKVEENATKDELKKAYRKQAMIHHPDKGGTPENFRRLNDAYNLVSGSTSRASALDGLTDEQREMLKDLIVKVLLTMLAQQLSRRSTFTRKRTFMDKIFRR